MSTTTCSLCKSTTHAYCRECIEKMLDAAVEKRLAAHKAASTPPKPPGRWVSGPPTKEGYYWLYDTGDAIMTVVFVRRHPIYAGRWQMAFGGPASLVNGGWYLISDDPEENGMLRSADPIALPEPPLVMPV